MLLALTLSSILSVQAQEPIGELAPFRTELLQIAFDSASGMPLRPHVKNRARAQEGVVETAVQLGLLDTALVYAEQIPNWRKGSALAAIAPALIESGRDDRARVALDGARGAMQAAVEAEEQSWRIDRIRAKIAAAEVLLEGVGDESVRAAELEPSEAGIVRAAEAGAAADDEYANQLDAIDAVVKTGDFDQVRGALLAGTRLYERFYDDRERRSEIATRIVDSWSGLPVLVRVDLLEAVTEIALDADDRDEAARWLAIADEQVASAVWTAEHEVPLRGRLARLRARAGQVERAVAELDAALERFEKEKRTIIDIYRADGLAPVAEAFASMGRADRAREVYLQAFDEAIVNINSRPRAEDIALLCCSMAEVDVQPDDELWSAIRAAQESLGEPW